MSRHKVAQFRFAVNQEGGGEHVINTISKALKCSALAFINTTKNKQIKEIADEVSRRILKSSLMVVMPK